MSAKPRQNSGFAAVYQHIKVAHVEAGLRTYNMQAPSLGKPVLVMRGTTERPEAVDAGTVKLVGTDSAAIVREVTRLLTDDGAYCKMAQARNPYGDGKAGERIRKHVMT